MQEIEESVMAMCVLELSTKKFWRPLLYCAVGLSMVLPLSALKCTDTALTCTELLKAGILLTV